MYLNVNGIKSCLPRSVAIARNDDSVDVKDLISEICFKLPANLESKVFVSFEDEPIMQKGLTMDIINKHVQTFSMQLNGCLNWSMDPLR